MNGKKNKDIFLKKHGSAGNNLILGEQVHGKNIEIVGKSQRGETIRSTDGLISGRESFFIGVTVADCIPISFFSKEVSGILHVGWRGLERGIIEEALQKIVLMGERVEKVFFEIGPSIGPCHFEVGDDVVERFKGYEKFLYREKGKKFLDIKNIAGQKLKNGGVKNLMISDKCTYCNPERYYSFRRDKKLKSMLALNYPLK